MQFVVELSNGRGSHKRTKPEWELEQRRVYARPVANKRLDSLAGSASGSLGPTNAAAFLIGGSSTCPSFPGLLDEIAIYNRALSDSEIQSIYAAQALDKCGIPPAFLAQPQSSTVVPGANIILSALIAGSNPMRYQWWLNGSVLIGATNSSLILSNVQPSDAGVYAFSASNVFGSVTSSNAVLKVQVITVVGNGLVLSNAEYVFSNSTVLTVQLQNAYTNGAMFYTLDGTTPTFFSTFYSGPFGVTQSSVLRVLGYDANFVQSSVSDPISLVFAPTYALSASTPGGGIVSVNPTNSTYLSNSMVTVTAAASNGWTFLQWAGDAAGTNVTNGVVMDRNKSVQALFGTGLGTSGSSGGSIVRSPSSALYPYGFTVQLSAVPQASNGFILWGSAASGNLNPLYFVLTNANPTVSALFGALPSNQVALTVIPVGHGQVSVVPRANVYTSGQLVTLTATADTNKAFLGWSGDAGGTQNPLSVSMNQSRTIYANFTKINNFSFAPLTGLGLSGGFKLNLTGEVPVAYRFDASSDLSAWTPLATLTNYVGTLQYADTSATNFNRRFYRAVPLP
jgi:uncharacterized repeat protein (TIGR02543 family)